ncbi:hypothetical protein B0A48_01361 [Cryoendolithus antarcticus]|uniref:Uncharacterized protein n=1 Tax=Cryoendolithus antarcticus TaxID=1507870 RepID=A0A1V8TT25_9PEZI|nr:hypothetical protein B0A48_01361 [Cryoendolithus antarcticus]
MSSQTHDPQEGVAAWVPQWDLSNFIDFYPLPTWLYNASRDLGCEVDVASTRFVVRGLVLGAVEFTTAVLTKIGMKPQGLGASTSTESFIAADTWQDVARIATQDRWRVSNLNEDDKEDIRISKWTNEHFADFAAWLVEDKDMTQSFHCTTSIVWCDACNDDLSSPSTPTAAPVVAYTCGICDRGDFDVCHECYVDKGTRCPKAYDCFLRANIGLWYEHNDEDLRELRSAATRGSADRFYKSLRATTNCRTWFASTTGYVGSTSHTTQRGDVVCVLFGARVPFMLRPEPDSRYRLIGDCYVDGMMDGKAVDMWEAGELKLEEFTLC